MNWQDQLIGLYLYICQHYETHLWMYGHRLSNNADPDLTERRFESYCAHQSFQ